MWWLDFTWLDFTIPCYAQRSQHHGKSKGPTPMPPGYQSSLSLHNLLIVRPSFPGGQQGFWSIIHRTSVASRQPRLPSWRLPSWRLRRKAIWAASFHHEPRSPPRTMLQRRRRMDRWWVPWLYATLLGVGCIAARWFFNLKISNK